MDTLFVTIFLFRSRNANADLHMHPLWYFLAFPFTVYFFTKTDSRGLRVQLESSWSHLCWHLVIGCSLISGCPSIIPDASVGVVYSPNFPWSYPSDISCEWRIRAPWGQRVKLTFIKFNLKAFSSCAYDYVKVLDGYYTQLGKYCGFQIPFSISSSSSSLTVEFHSDSSDTFSGFLALYQTGYSFPTRAPVWPTYTPVWPTYRPWTTYRPYYPTTASALQHSCSSYSSEISKFTNFL